MSKRTVYTCSTAIVLAVTLLASSGRMLAGVGKAQPFDASDSARVYPLPFNEKRLVSLKAQSNVELVSEGTPLSGSCSLSLLRSDSLYMRLYGPFGILLGKISACATRVMYFDATVSELFEGNPESESMLSRLPVPLSYNDIVHIMRAEVLYEPALYKSVAYAKSVESDDAIALLRYNADQRFVDFAKFSQKDSTLLSYQRKTRSDSLLFNVNFSKYISKDGVRFPTVISIVFPPRNIQMRFEISDIEVNQPAESYTFTIPRGVHRTKLD